MALSSAGPRSNWLMTGKERERYGGAKGLLDAVMSSWSRTMRASQPATGSPVPATLRRTVR